GGIGAAFAALWRQWLPGVTFSSEGLYALAAMAAVFGGIARAPFTAVIFLFELSRNASAVLPLIVCVMIADAIVRLLSENSMMTGKLAKRGLFVSQDYVAPLFQLWTADIGQVMQPLPEQFDLDATLKSGGVIKVKDGDSIAATAHRLLEQHATQAVVMSREPDSKPMGLAHISDILAIEDQRVRRHDHRESQLR
ncbi:MAG: chloride channel protein, partial [Terriglobales bacterium]